MHHFTIHATKTNLSKLIALSMAGEEVVFAKGNTPVARLVAISHQPFKFAILAGHLSGPGPDFLTPLDEAELAGWEGGSDHDLT